MENFDLITGYPPKPVKDFTKTLEEADLLESSLIQKITQWEKLISVLLYKPYTCM